MEERKRRMWGISVVSQTEIEEAEKLDIHNQREVKISETKCPRIETG